MVEFIAGHQLIELQSVDSTNNFAAKLLDCQHPVEGTVILSHKQTKGKGQRHAEWISEDGMNLTFSIILYPKFIDAHEQMILNQMVSLAVLKFLQNKTEKTVQIKWPNDILVDEKKICGILIENSISGKHIEHSIIGIGLNLNQEDFQGFKATSLSLIEGKNYDIKTVLSELLSAIDHVSHQARSSNIQSIKQDYINNLFRYDQIAKYSFNGNTISAKIEGLDQAGRLVLFDIERNEKLICGIKEIEFIY